MTTLTLINYMNFPGFKKRIPLGPLSLLSNISIEPDDWRFIDLQSDSCSVLEQDVLECLGSDESKYIAVSATSLVFPWMFNTLEAIKRQNPEKKIVLGGSGPSSCAKPIMQEFPFIDYLVIGEGETALNELISGTPDHKIPNIMYRTSGNLVSNARIRENLASLKTNYTLFKDKKYEDFSSIITSRGCFYDCGFCYNRDMWGPRTQRKDIDTIFDEISQINKNFGINYVKIVDDLFIQSKDMTDAFFLKYIKENHTFKYQLMGARLDQIDTKLLSRLAATNCTSIWFGIESGSAEIRKKINKNLRINDLTDQIKLITDNIPSSLASFIVGFPFESMDEFNKTLDMASDLYSRDVDIAISFLRPQNNTRIYDVHRESLFYLDHPRIISPRNITPDVKAEILSKPEIYTWFYTYNTPSLEKKIELFEKLDFKPRNEYRQKLLETTN